MATTPTQIRIDTTVKEQANNLFASLGMDMSSKDIPAWQTSKPLWSLTIDLHC